MLEIEFINLLCDEHICFYNKSLCPAQKENGNASLVGLPNALSSQKEAGTFLFFNIFHMRVDADRRWLILAA